MKIAALIGPTASGKSALAFAAAQKTGAWIFSIDSLSIYRHIDIISAKPSKAELEAVRHFGIDVLQPDEAMNAALVQELYGEAGRTAAEAGRSLIIVGGSSFYLKALLEGLSEGIALPAEVLRRVEQMIETDPVEARVLLERVDPVSAGRIVGMDRFRLAKALGFWLTHGRALSAHFDERPPQGLLGEIPVFDLAVDRAVLGERIALRTRLMLEGGAIDETAWLESRYGRASQAMKAIGIREILDYFDGTIGRSALEELITVHTRQLAKRQETFNRSQFGKVVRGGAAEIAAALEAYLQV